MPRDHVNVRFAIVVSGAGRVSDVSKGEPTVVVELKSVRTARANCTAPATFSSPAPCSNMLNPAIGCAVYINNAFTRFGVKLGFAWSISAAVPAATGVDIEVPLKYIILRLSAPLTPG